MKKPDTNLQVIGTDNGVGENHGMVVGANSSRFVDSNFSEPITDFVVGLLGSELAPLIAELNLLAPAVRVGRRFEFKKSKKGLAFLADLDDSRAIGAAFTKVSDERDTVNSKTVNRGLTITLDRDDMMDGDAETAARMLTAMLIRNDIKRTYALLLAASSNTGKVWDASADPDGDVLSSIYAVLSSRGLLPNTMVYGATAWLQRRTSYITNTGDGTGALATLTPDQVAASLAVERLLVSKSVAKSSKKGAKSLMLANLVIGYYADSVASKDDASNLKRFYTPCRDGSDFAVYIDEKDKTVDVTVEQYSSPTITDSTGIVTLAVTAS